MPALWCASFGQNIPTGLSFPLPWVISALHTHNTDGVSGCWSQLSGETWQMRHSICVWDCPGGPATPCCRSVQWQSPAWAPAHPHHHPLTQGLHRAVKFLKYLLEPAVPEAPSPLPCTYLAENYCQPLPVTPAGGTEPIPPDQGELSPAGWPGWGQADTGGRDWLQVAGETLSLGCPWDLAKRSVLQARHTVRGDGGPG